MRKSDSPPDHLIDKIVRHTGIILTAPYGCVKYMEAARLLKKEVRKLETYKRQENERIETLPQQRLPQEALPLPSRPKALDGKKDDKAGTGLVRW